MANQAEGAEFDRMLAQTRPMLVRLARQYAAPGELQDLLQDILLQLWRSFGSHGGRASRSTWVYRVALNTAIGHARRPRRPDQPLHETPEPAHLGGPEGALPALEEFLCSLAEVQRAVMLLHLEGLEPPAIAEVLGLTPAAVAVRLTRLRQAFERHMTEE